MDTCQLVLGYLKHALTERYQQQDDEKDCVGLPVVSLVSPSVAVRVLASAVPVTASAVSCVSLVPVRQRCKPTKVSGNRWVAVHRPRQWIPLNNPSVFRIRTGLKAG